MKPAIQRFIDEVLKVSPDVDILMDGYDYAIPNGKRINLVVKKIGPWILPSMGKKGIIDKVEQKNIVKTMVDIFNNMLHDLDKANARFHYINLLGMFPDPKDWHNEIHLKKAGFKKVAKEYHKTIVSILGGVNPISIT